MMSLFLFLVGAAGGASAPRQQDCLLAIIYPQQWLKEPKEDEYEPGQYR